MSKLDIDKFEGGVTLECLYELRYRQLPTQAGVYLVRRDASDQPDFLEGSPAGWFKGKDPSYPLSRIHDEWVAGADIVYIGKAAGARGLRQRVQQLVDFGFGKSVGHRGGRALWHLADHGALKLHWLVCATEDADTLETDLIETFRHHHGTRPFANMVK